ncbi:hypothetical protein NFI96_009485 [Prochilodus magdalenae]|nr:hypothetical protein NFI96_009485 [Prochilodus magdalenae]
MSAIEHASSQSIKPFRSCEEYLYAMKEDLAEWLKDLYRVDVNVHNLVDVLETGDLLCAHANNVTRVAAEFGRTYGRTHLQLPTSGVTFVSSAQPSTFLARDNVSNFINWCRNQMNIKDVLMFETDDLVLRKNEKNFVLCLLEVARRASRFGMAAPVLIQLEQEIEKEILEEMEMPAQETTQPVTQRRIQNTQNLDDMILRNHVMVRVGGGWDTLEHYLDKHDPCRCTSLSKGVTDINLMFCFYLISCCTLKERTESKDDSVLRSTSRMGREATRVSPSPRLASSLPRPARPSTPPQPETRRPTTPLVFQKVQSQTSPQYQQGQENRVGHNWSKSHFVSKLRQTATAGPKCNEERPSIPQNPTCSVSSRPFLCITPDPILNTNRNSLEGHQTPTISIQESDENGNARKTPDFIRTFCPSKGLMAVVSGKARARSLSPSGKKDQASGSSDLSARHTPTLDGNERSQQRCFSYSKKKQYLDLPIYTVQNFSLNVSKSDFKISGHHPIETSTNVESRSGEQEMKNRYIFTPPPISPAQEAVLYQSLEEEILSNLQQLGMDSDASVSENDQYSPRPETPLNSPEMSYEIQKASPPMSSSSSKPNDAKEARFQAVIGELSNWKKPLEKASVENWVNTNPSRLNVSKPSVASSWSSLGSSIDSIEPSKASNRIVETDLTCNSPNSGTCKLEKPRVSSFCQKRSLKKPERVPSIYKLKLKPCIHPRRDHRPDKKPSKIPKPVSYRGAVGEAFQSECFLEKQHLRIPLGIGKQSA